MPVVLCDAEDGMCGYYAEDHHAMGASSVDGVPCTPVPQGWSVTPDSEHLCPRHANGGEPS